MSYDIAQTDILAWAEQYDGEPFHALLCDPLFALSALYLSIGASMARLAKRDEVCEVIRFFVALHAKQPKWTNMMHALPRTTAILTGVFVAFQGFTALRCPIRAAIVIAAIDILWMVQTMPVLIAAGARAILTAAPACFQDTFIYPKGFTTVKAIKGLVFGFRRASFNGRVLAFRRTMFAASMFQSRWYLLKDFTTVFAV